MAKHLYYHAAEHVAADTARDPYLRPAFSVQDRVRRQIWKLC